VDEFSIDPIEPGVRILRLIQCVLDSFQPIGQVVESDIDVVLDHALELYLVVKYRQSDVLDNPARLHVLLKALDIVLLGPKTGVFSFVKLDGGFVLDYDLGWRRWPGDVEF